MACKIIWLEEEGLHVKHEGEVSLNDIFEVNRIITNDPRYRLLKYHISDFTGIEDLLMSKKDLESLSDFHVIPTLLYPNLKLLIVSNNPKVQKKVLEYMKFMTSNAWEITLFDNFNKALEWGKSI